MQKIIIKKDEHITKNCTKEIKRLAARAVIVIDGKILLIKTNKGDYKFPGGGLEDGESAIVALKREVLEETGYKVSAVKELIITATSTKPDQFEDNTIFKEESHYYNCEIDTERCHRQVLDDYERELDFTAQFVRLQDALDSNVNLLENNPVDLNPWVARDTEALKILNNRA